MTTLRMRGSTVLNVKNHGAVGDGVHDDTDAFTATFAALLAEDPLGGTVFVPAGDYLIDTSKSIRPLSNTALQLDPDARLHTKPTTLERAYLISARNIHDFELIGSMGNIIGDRATFVSRTNSTQEWRHGIAIYACKHITVRDLNISDCVGDAISIGGATPCDDIVIDNVSGTNCRRQGISIVNGKNIVISRSRMTKQNGTSPECGIDIEPEKDDICQNITIDTCDLSDNAHYGLNVILRANLGAALIDGVKVINTNVERNRGNGICLVGAAKNISINGGNVDNNNATGLLIDKGVSNVRVGQITFWRNYAKLADKPRLPFSYTGWKTSLERDILYHLATGATLAGQGIVIDLNYYR